MKKGEWIYTPRFCKVKIEKVFSCEETARKQGFVEPAYYKDSECGILGKITGLNTMSFAAYKR